MSLSQVNSQIAQRYNLSSDTGAYISAITTEDGAGASDLQVGDIITAIDGKSVSSPTDVTLDVRAHKVGDTVKVTVNRDGETLDVEVTLTSDESAVSAMAGDADEQEQGQGQGQDGWNGRNQGNGRDQGYSIEDILDLLNMQGR